MCPRENLKLDEKLSESLRNQPESGMGYQVVKVVLGDGSSYENVAVTNCDTVVGIYGFV